MAALAGTVTSCSDLDVASTALSPLLSGARKEYGQRRNFQRSPSRKKEDDDSEMRQVGYSVLTVHMTSWTVSFVVAMFGYKSSGVGSAVQPRAECCIDEKVIKSTCSAEVPVASIIPQRRIAAEPSTTTAGVPTTGKTTLFAVALERYNTNDSARQKQCDENCFVKFPTTRATRPNGPSCSCGLSYVSHRRSPTRPSAKTSCLSLGALMPAWAAHRSNLSSPRGSLLFSDEVLLLSSATASAFKHDWGGTHSTMCVARCSCS